MLGTRTNRAARAAALLAAVVVIASAVSFGAEGQARPRRTPPDRPGLALRGAPAPVDPPVLPRPVPPDRADDRVREFHARLGSLAGGTMRRARLERARRIAPFDLDWGLP